MNRKGFIPAWLVTFAAFALALILMAGFFFYMNQVESVTPKVVKGEHMPSLAARDIVALLQSPAKGDFTLAELVSSTAVTGRWSELNPAVQGSVLNLLRQRGCRNCLWFLQVTSEGSVLHTWPEGVNVDFIRKIWMPVIVGATAGPLQPVSRKRAYSAVQVLSSPIGPLIVEYVAGRPGAELETYEVFG